MAFNINDMRGQMVGGGARPSQFMVQLTNPSDSASGLKTPFMVQAATLPASTIGEVPVGYFGRIIKYAGDRTFDPWTVTVYNDEDFIVRNSLEAWMADINGHIANTSGFANPRPLNYKQQANVRQFGKNGSVIREYTFYGLFPTQLSEVTLDWNTQNQIETFQVTFAYDYWSVSGGTTGLGKTQR